MTQVHPRPNPNLLKRGYSLLLFAYPKAYRSEYSHWMRQAFDDLSADAFQREGWTGLATFALNIAADTLVSAARERRAAGALNLFAALRAHFRALMLLGALCFALSGITYLQPGIQYIYVSIYRVFQHLFMLGFGLVGLGLIGASNYLPFTAKWLLRASGIACITSLAWIGMVTTLPQDSFLSSLWTVVMLVFMAQFWTLAAAGIATWGVKHHWGLLSVALGIGPHFYWTQLSGRGILVGPSWPDTVVFLAIGIGWALLALAIGRARPKVQQLETVFEFM
ncbi:MAG: hypothetical protein IPK52_14000 [Chloroflexi bacterium]|nr:hypothetical protein [Chloroflexota bacterium]